MVQSKSMTELTTEEYSQNEEMRTKSPSNSPLKPVLLAAALIFAGMGISISIQADAHAYCYKPTPPYKPFSFTSNDQINAYNKKVDDFNIELNSYRQCMSRSYDLYTNQFKAYLSCEAQSYGKAYSNCARPSPPTQQ
jgi:hypothetical protein